MNHPPRVLIVDRSLESREVLRTALERGDAVVLEADRADVGLELLRTETPEVVVLDDETRQQSRPAALADFDRAVQSVPASLVVLGTARRTADGLGSAEFVAKPYHYAPLVRRIEALLACRDAAAGARLAGDAPRDRAGTSSGGQGEREDAGSVASSSSGDSACSAPRG